MMLYRNKSLSKNAEFLLEDRYYMRDVINGPKTTEEVTLKNNRGTVSKETAGIDSYIEGYAHKWVSPTEFELLETPEDTTVRVDYRPILKEKNFEEVARRIARYMALAELNYTADINKVRQIENLFFLMIYNRFFLPNSPTIFNAGKGMLQLMDADGVSLLHKFKLSDEEYLRLWEYWKAHPETASGMLSACFVLPIDDSMESIYSTLKDAAMVMKTGGGVGFNFSKLRAEGSNVGGTAGISSGPISFMHLFNASGKTIEQGGVRRAAMMGILDSTHPDILKFVKAKKNNDGNSILNYFNISVNIKDPKEFKKAVELNQELTFTDEKHGKSVTYKAREFLRMLAEHAWASGDPGLIFIDRHNSWYSMGDYDPVESTNPCGELPLPPYGACNLGSLNLVAIIQESFINAVTREDKLDFNTIEKVLKTFTKVAMRFLDNVIDMNRFPLEKITQKVRDYRPVGLGFMGLADALIMLGLKYSESAGFVAWLQGALSLASYEASHELAEERGVFAAYQHSKFTNPEYIPFPMKNPDEYPEYAEQIAAVNLRILSFFNEVRTFRNSQCNTVAPTGTISNLADVSSGVEPNFMLKYTRYVTQKDGTRVPLTYVHWLLETVLSKEDLEAFKNGKDLKEISPEIAELFQTTEDITPEQHLAIQEAVQAYLDASISKTINLPNSTTVDDIFNIYLKALGMNVKGITVYRDGSLNSQVLVKEEKPKKSKKKLDFSLDSLKTPTPEVKLDMGAIEERIAQIKEYVTQGLYSWNSKGFYVDNRTGDIYCPVCGEKNSIKMLEGCMMCTACSSSKCL